MALIIDYNKAPHELLGTANNDDIILKNNATTVVFGGGGNDEILTAVNTTRDQIYGGISLYNPATDDYYGHIMPSNKATYNALWNHDGRDIGHGGDNDWMKLGSDADTAVWHPNPGGYKHPGINFGFNPDEGDKIIFAHDEGFTVKNIVGAHTATDHPDMWEINKVDMVGHDSDFLLDGEWMQLDFTSDGRGPGVNHITGIGDHRMLIEKSAGSAGVAGVTHDVTEWLHEHDAGYYNPGANDAFIF